MHFNAITRQTRHGMKKDHLTPMLNGFDYKTSHQDGMAHFAYTGKGWICWRDKLVLGTGWADIDPNWFDGLCRYLNASKFGGITASPFVYLGFGSPIFGSSKFNQWLTREGQERGFKQMTSKDYLFEAHSFAKDV